MPTIESILNNCPEWMQIPFKTMDVDWENIAENELDWLNLWDTEIRDSSRDI
jgi:iron(III) transport system substrate-binding protein